METDSEGCPKTFEGTRGRTRGESGSVGSCKGRWKEKKKIRPFKLEPEKAGRCREGSECSERRKGVRWVTSAEAEVRRGGRVQKHTRGFAYTSGDKDVHGRIRAKSPEPAGGGNENRGWKMVKQGGTPKQ